MIITKPYFVGVAFNTMMFTPSFMKIHQFVQKLRHT